MRTSVFDIYDVRCNSASTFFLVASDAKGDTTQVFRYLYHSFANPPSLVSLYNEGKSWPVCFITSTALS